MYSVQYSNHGNYMYRQQWHRRLFMMSAVSG